MAFNPCTDCPEGCSPNHNMEAIREPNGGDDPCDTNNEGVFYCPGSLWYLPDENDPCNNRLWIRIGGDCGVNQWLEIPVGNFNDTFSMTAGLQSVPDIGPALPEGQGNAIVFQGPNITDVVNDSPCYDMEVVLNISSAGINARNQGGNTPNIGSDLVLVIDGNLIGLPANNNGNADLLPNGLVYEILRGSQTVTFTVPPATTIQVEISTTAYVINGPFVGPAAIDGFFYTFFGIAQSTI